MRSIFVLVNVKDKIIMCISCNTILKTTHILCVLVKLSNVSPQFKADIGD